ncbi:phosphoribosyltransferase domain-containing protein [Pseudomonas sp. RP23018S]|uniref:phosphoribosyltransferase domain-containing protein n=1 Tax=Pseudomonas sp. RP23018S TaxID=3096037 RepID=UPI003A1004C6
MTTFDGRRPHRKHSAVNQQPIRLSAALTRGVLDVDVHGSRVAAQALFGFAERRNPKRAFLFVSKVLGKHIPVKPSVMEDTYQALAAQIPADLPGPVLLIGMAETAVGLGAGVHRVYSADRADSMYLVSTRHPVSEHLFTRFEEEHSHASAHLVHEPVDPVLSARLRSARSLVMIDDEASTGRTFVNLHRALVAAGVDQLERVVTCVLTDWSSGALSADLGASVEQVSLLSGAYAFTENPEAALPQMPETGTVAIGEWPLDPANDWGRLGTCGVRDTLGSGVTVTPGERVLVLGTGEFVWKPFLLAERLERAGAEVYFSSTTRSPIALGHCIEHALSFSDNYGLGIVNFLYNVAPGQFDRVLICSETDAQAVPRTLIDALNAEVLVDGQ